MLPPGRPPARRLRPRRRRPRKGPARQNQSIEKSQRAPRRQVSLTAKIDGQDRQPSRRSWPFFMCCVGQMGRCHGLDVAIATPDKSVFGKCGQIWPKCTIKTTDSCLVHLKNEHKYVILGFSSFGVIAQSCILEIFGYENDKGFYAVREKSLIAITKDFLDAGCMFWHARSAVRSLRDRPNGHRFEARLHKVQAARLACARQRRAGFAGS